ncbi:stage V sporulation protein B [Candidatus Desulforudis audaxviator]|uniref:Polysaccharide biosynthesis protein n=1 Tax=Desulforudis audaxviator (strain MP104C) TaxID=477974 RepID=B1I3X4_DESAP|nr:stage V sporulation protein B [Candidatus Desulforudis audaxviator]ACA59741.1 polysaccharide biosynthesis protein [Candidatus Desulforudis audaxviator MP104C]AZK59736.1 Stage V sporulation protein B [Candidatus Desulforudis audaxviator]
MPEKQSVAQGTLVLTASSLFNRILGFVYQVLMVRLLKAEGIGLFSMIYPVYVLFLVVASAGIPVAIAKVVAEESARGNLANAYRIFRISLGFVFGSALVLTVALLHYGTPLLIMVFDNPDVHLAFKVLTPGILVVSVCSAFRGFFQGLQQMTPTAVTQAVEQSVRVVCGLVLAYLLMPRGIAWATAGASAGVVLGELSGFLLMLLIFFTRRPAVGGGAGVPAFTESLGVISRRIFSLAGPVTVSRVLSTALLSVDAVMIPKRLAAAGLSTAEATASYGKLAGMAQTLLFTPGIFTISLATALLPAISSAHARGDTALLLNRVGSALRLTLLIGIPSAVIFLTLSRHICGLLFGYPDAGAILQVLALGGPFLYIIQTTTGILQGLGKAVQPLVNLLIASLLKIAGVYYLTAVPGLAMNGVALALVAHLMVMALLNLRDIRRLTGYRLDYLNSLGKTSLGALAMVAVIQWVNPAPDSVSGTLQAGLGGLAAYLGVVVSTGALAREERTRLDSLVRDLLGRGRGR